MTWPEQTTLKKKTFTITIALVVLACLAFDKNCFANDSEAGVSLDIYAGVVVCDTEEKEKPELDREVEPFVLTKLQYTFDGGNQIYIGNPLENKGEPSVGASFGNGLIEVSAFYITTMDVYKDPYLAEREETTQDGFGTNVSLNIKSFKASHELRHTKVKDDQIAERIKELSRDVLTHNFSASYHIEMGKLFFVEPDIDVIFAINRTNKNNNSDDDWSEIYRGAKIGLTLTKIFGKIIASISAKVGENQYAKDDPIFDEERVDDVSNFTGFIKWLAPFGYENCSVIVVGGVETNDSSIEFYDRDGVYGGMAVGYHF